MSRKIIITISFICIILALIFIVVDKSNDPKSNFLGYRLSGNIVLIKPEAAVLPP